MSFCLPIIEKLLLDKYEKKRGTPVPSFLHCAPVPALSPFLAVWPVMKENITFVLLTSPWGKHDPN